MDTTALAERLAQEIRRVDGSHSLGAAALAEALVPFVESLRAVAGEPVTYQFQDADGRWHGFHSDKHRDDTIADGSWPIRALYAEPQPATPATVTDEDVERAQMILLERGGYVVLKADMRAALESFANKETP